jgi:hypothetical protein
VSNLLLLDESSLSLSDDEEDELPLPLLQLLEFELDDSLSLLKESLFLLKLLDRLRSSASSVAVLSLMKNFF